MASYTATFRRILLGVTDASVAEARDRYVRGLRRDVQLEVCLRVPCTWEDAATIAGTRDGLVQGAMSVQAPCSSWQSPMELDAVQQAAP